MSEWSIDPDDWSHTPPLAVYRELEKSDPDLFWVMAVGHAQNLLDSAIEEIERLRGLLIECSDREAVELAVELYTALITQTLLTDMEGDRADRYASRWGRAGERLDDLIRELREYAASIQVSDERPGGPPPRWWLDRDVVLKIIDKYDPEVSDE